MGETNRRELLKSLGVVTAGVATVTVGGGDAWAEDGPLAAAIHHHMEAAEQAAVPAHAKFFQGRELRTMQRLTDLILPSDGTPGAKDAGVTEFLDFYLAGSTDASQKRFRKGMAEFDGVISAKTGKAFVDLSDAQQSELLAAVWPPATSGEVAAFLLDARRLTAFAFYTSKVGIKELGYAGNTYEATFPGACTHQHEL
jgi:gluconate 2-dehydrogenase gamma chain